MKVHFLYGTETGNSEIVCEDIREDLGLDGAEITPLGEIDPAAMDAGTFYLIVTASHGNGDLPAMAQPFFDALEPGAHDLSHVRFAIFGLGDMVFAETYNQGSERLMERLLASGAKQVGTRGLHDASSIDLPEDVAIPWAQEIMTSVSADAA